MCSQKLPGTATGTKAWQPFTKLRDWPDLMHSVLNGVLNGTIPIDQFGKECKERQNIMRVRTQLMNHLHVETWNEAMKKDEELCSQEKVSFYLTLSNGEWI